MKTLILVVFFLLAAVNGCFAQQPVLITTELDSVAAPRVAIITPVASDELRQMVHKVFRRGRHLALFTTVGAGTIFVSNSAYVLTGSGSPLVLFNIFWSGGGAATGITGLTQFSRRRERVVMTELGSGQPLPVDIDLLVNLWRK